MVGGFAFRLVAKRVEYRFTILINHKLFKEDLTCCDESLEQLSTEILT